MTPLTGAMFLTAMRRSAPCLEAERQRRTSILVSADAGRARLVSRVPLRPRCRKSGSVPGWRAPDYRLTAVGLGPRGSGPLLKRVGRQALASSPASEASSPRSRALIRPSGRSLAPARSRLAVGGRRHRRSAVQRPPLRSVQPALEGVDPDREPGAPVGQELNRDAETRMRIEQGLVASGSPDRAGSARSRFASVPIVRRRGFDPPTRR